MNDIHFIIFIIGCFTVIGVVVGSTLLLRSDLKDMKADMHQMKAERKAEIQGVQTELKADIKAVDDRLRLVQLDVIFIRGFLAGRLPGVSEAIPTGEPTIEGEQVSEAAGD